MLFVGFKGAWSRFCLKLFYFYDFNPCLFMLKMKKKIDKSA